MSRMPGSFLCATLIVMAGCDERENGLGPALSRLDRTRPTIVATRPSHGATQVGLTVPITVTFSEPVRPASTTRPAITFDPPIAGPVSFAGNAATVTPSSPLAPNTIYVGTVTTDVEDLARNHLGAPFTWTFTTGTPGPFAP